jgi:hypothetical protein
MRIEGSFGFGQQGYTVHWDKPKTNGSGPAGREKDNDTTDEALEAKPTTHGNQQGREEVPFIAGMILIGPFLTTAAAICLNSPSIPYRSPARNGSSVPHMAPARLLRMSPSLCWELLQV